MACNKGAKNVLMEFFSLETLLFVVNSGEFVVRSLLIFIFFILISYFRK